MSLDRSYSLIKKNYMQGFKLINFQKSKIHLFCSSYLTFKVAVFLVGWHVILQSISNYDYNTHKGPYIGYYVHHNYQKTYRLIPPLINRLTYRQVVPPPPPGTRCLLIWPPPNTAPPSGNTSRVDKQKVVHYQTLV